MGEGTGHLGYLGGLERDWQVSGPYTVGHLNAGCSLGTAFQCQAFEKEWNKSSAVFLAGVKY